MDKSTIPVAIFNSYSESQREKTWWLMVVGGMAICIGNHKGE